MGEKWLEMLQTGLEELGLVYQEQQIEQLQQFMATLLDYNRRTNLTAIADPEEVVVKHFLDSLAAARHIPPDSSVIDVGTGGGFPGIPLKIVMPSLQAVLIDSVRKKVDFLRLALGRLGLEDIVAYHARAEDLGQDSRFRGQFYISLSRAVSALRILLEYQLPFLREGGLALIYKARGIEDEVSEAANAMGVLGGRLREVVELHVPYLQAQRQLLIIEKIGPTPGKYPRRAGMPGKRPL
ncbi:MAG: 16S rRNA (guanine(527)-N(7))-methyltransferase RsmG [Halanaerobium sp.]|nr:16S rRNA (guanine(527)-N(7))-methyltransferase RsmG [Halanaerobium sp.]